MHEDEIGRARWRIRLVAAAGVVLLAVTIAVLVFPIAVVVFGGFALLGGSFGLGMSLLALSAAVSVGIGIVSSAGVFTWSLSRAEQRALEFVRAWPYPGSPPAPPPRMPPGAYERAQRLVQGLAIAAGVLPPSCAVVIDDAPNCLTVGRNPKTAWIVVTTGLLDLPRTELEAVLAFEIGRVAELEVSFDTVVYACSARGFELWAAAFGEFDETSLLLAPFAVLLTPVVGGGMLLRAAALRTRAASRTVWPSGTAATRSRSRMDSGASLRTRPRCDAVTPATRTCGSSTRTRARLGGSWGRTASCPAGSSASSASLESAEQGQDARFGSSSSRSPSASPLRNSLDARPRDRASLGSCELPNRRHRTASTMSRSGPMISPRIGAAPIAPPFALRRAYRSLDSSRSRSAVQLVAVVGRAAST